jgi:hypothetical protein
VPTKLYVLPSYNFVLSSSSRCIIDADRCTLAPVRNGRPCDVDVQVSSRDPGILRNKTGDSVYQTQGVQRRQNERSNPGHENATRQGKGKGSGNHTYVRVLLRVCRRGSPSKVSSSRKLAAAFGGQKLPWPRALFSDAVRRRRRPAHGRRNHFNLAGRTGSYVRHLLRFKNSFLVETFALVLDKVTCTRAS